MAVETAVEVMKGCFRCWPQHLHGGRGTGAAAPGIPGYDPDFCMNLMKREHGLQCLHRQMFFLLIITNEEI